MHALDHRNILKFFAWCVRSCTAVHVAAAAAAPPAVVTTDHMGHKYPQNTRLSNEVLLHAAVTGAAQKQHACEHRQHGAAAAPMSAA
jgi:hypothetical protein